MTFCGHFWSFDEKDAARTGHQKFKTNDCNFGCGGVYYQIMSLLQHFLEFSRTHQEIS